ncbi:F-box protein At3g07870-like [Papaver somniferum]|uniref:F-box protein At3g07870-like n=1 Tax=Papaver somniferum TaxID=3469 RepID=UPI000E705469|nr:F-box protein At3g07870-like [Papaver somniferum]
MESTMFNMEDLPKDIVSIILSRVTGECVLNCKLVCKIWETLLRDRKVKEGLLYFATLRRHAPTVRWERTATFYYGDYDDIMSDDYTVNPLKPLTKIEHPKVRRGDANILIGSCNGLVCLGISNNHGVPDPVHVCNPFTGEYANLPMLNMDKSGDFSVIVYGFGYLQKTNEYKVVRIYYPSYPGVGSVQIYTLGSRRGWRSIGEIKHNLCNPGILADETLYFMNAGKQEIVALDLAGEAFQLVLPPCIQDPEHSTAHSYLKLIGEHLCVVYARWGVKMDIWSFKETNKQKSSFALGKDYNSWSWSLEYSIPWNFDVEVSYEPFALTKSNEILLWKDYQTLVSYSPETATFKTFENHYMRYETSKAIPHRNTRVSLKALGVSANMIRYNAKATAHSFFLHLKPQTPRPGQLQIPEPWQMQAHHPWQYIPNPPPWHYDPIPHPLQQQIPRPWQYVPIPHPWQQQQIPHPWQQQQIPHPWQYVPIPPPWQPQIPHPWQYFRR